MSLSVVRCHRGRQVLANEACSRCKWSLLESPLWSVVQLIKVPAAASQLGSGAGDPNIRFCRFYLGERHYKLASNKRRSITDVTTTATVIYLPVQDVGPREQVSPHSGPGPGETVAWWAPPRSGRTRRDLCSARQLSGRFAAHKFRPPAPREKRAVQTNKRYRSIAPLATVSGGAATAPVGAEPAGRPIGLPK